MKIVYPTVALILALALAASAWAARQITGSGVSRTETRSAAGFHGIALGVDAAVEIRQGAGEGLTITGDDNVLPLVETVVDDGVLKIRWARGDYSTTYKALRIVVDVKTLDSVALGGSGSIHAAKLATPSLAAKLGGSGELAIDGLDAKSATITSAGSGRVTVAGRADALDLTLAGSGEVEAGKLRAQTVRATVRGSAQATVWAKEALQVTIAGSGEVRYYGTPKLTQTIAGSGSVSKAGDAP
jgi:hypothetical protein